MHKSMHSYIPEQSPPSEPSLHHQESDACAAPTAVLVVEWAIPPPFRTGVLEGSFAAERTVALKASSSINSRAIFIRPPLVMRPYGRMGRSFRSSGDIANPGALKRMVRVAPSGEPSPSDTPHRALRPAFRPPVFPGSGKPGELVIPRNGKLRICRLGVRLLSRPHHLPPLPRKLHSEAESPTLHPPHGHHAAIAQLDRATDYESVGWRFDSFWLHHPSISGPSESPWYPGI